MIKQDWENNENKFKDFTAEKLAELKNAFAMGFTDSEACLYADVWVRRFYDYCIENEDFRELKELLKQKPKMKAKLNIMETINMKVEKEDIKAIERKLDTSKWYLERKAKDEFSLRSEIEGNMTNETTMKVEYVEADHSKYNENWEVIEDEKEENIL